MSCVCACLLSGITCSVWANPRIEWNNADSTSVQRAERDLSELKKHVQLSKVQEDHLYNMFLGKYQYLEQHEASGPRWEWTMETNKRKLQELLGEEAFTRLDKAGLIEEWFGITQEQ